MKDKQITLTLKDILEDESVLQAVSEGIAKNLCDNKFFDEEEDDGYIDKFLKPAVRKELNELANTLIKKQIERIMKDDYTMRNMVSSSVSDYILEKLVGDVAKKKKIEAKEDDLPI